MDFYERYTTCWTEDSVRIINTPSPQAKSSYFYIQQTGYFKTLPGYFTERTDLPSYLLLYSVSGKGLLTYEGQEYKINPGQAVYIDCMPHHKYQIVGDDLWEFYWVHFYGGMSDAYYEIFRAENGPVTGDMSRSELKQIFVQLSAVNLRNEKAAELETSRLLLNLITTVIMEPMLCETAKMPEYIRGAVRYIEDHFAEPLSLDRIASHLSVSKFHLSREFKKYIGDSPGEYLIRCRINKAKELLKTTDLPIGQIAELVGVASEHHFREMFKQRTEETPGQFRKLWGGNN